MTDADRPAPARVRVTSPRTAATRQRVRTVAQEIDEDTAIGEVYVRSLVRSQLRLALGVVALLALGVGTLPVLFATTAVDDLRLGGVPLAWLVLGVLVYPALIALGVLYVRRAERNERAFTDLVERP